MSSSTSTPTVNDSWRGWIAENLVLGSRPEELAGIMVQSGIDPADARAEVEAALRSPYLRGTGRLNNRLAKRDQPPPPAGSPGPT